MASFPSTCTRHALALVGFGLLTLYPKPGAGGDSTTQEVRIEIKLLNQLEVAGDQIMRLAAHPSATEATTQDSQLPLSNAESYYRVYSNSSRRKKVTAELMTNGEPTTNDLYLYIGSGDTAPAGTAAQLVSTRDSDSAVDLQTGITGSGSLNKIQYSGHLDNGCSGGTGSKCRQPIAAVIKLTLVDE